MILFIGYSEDTFKKAERRINRVINRGFSPVIKLWINPNGKKYPLWEKFRKQWVGEIKTRKSLPSQPLLCDNDDDVAICSGCKFAGDHGPATGAFTLCKGCLGLKIECDGLPFGDIKIYNETEYNKVVWEEGT